MNRKPFDNITNLGKEKLLKTIKAHITFYKKNTIILKEDNEIGIILNGYIQIIKSNYNGTKNIIQEFYDDDVLGTDLFFSNDSEYEIIAKEDTNLIIINYNEIINTNKNDKNFNEFIKNMFIILNNKTIEKNERINILTKKTIRNKLLEYFEINYKKTGSKNIYLPFNFTDLADYIAVDRSAMSRELSYLKNEGFIEIKGKKITLLYK